MMMNGAEAQARQEQLWKLWEALLDACIEYMANPPDGIYKASSLGVVRAFLKDNNIQVDMAGIADMKDSLSALKGAIDVPFK